MVVYIVVEQRYEMPPGAQEFRDAVCTYHDIVGVFDSHKKAAKYIEKKTVSYPYKIVKRDVQ